MKNPHQRSYERNSSLADQVPDLKRSNLTAAIACSPDRGSGNGAEVKNAFREHPHRRLDEQRDSIRGHIIYV